MKIHFDCTKCGRCCHDLRLTLSIDEAIAWAKRGDRVQLLVEALPWPDDSELADPDPADDQHIYNRDRTFPAISGTIPIRVAIIPVAHHDGPCPHLLPDMRCGNYEARPRICRIYPLESRPFTKLERARKACPPDAWADHLTVITTDLGIVDPEKGRIVTEYRRAVVAEIPVLAAACAALRISTAAFANEGFAVHTPAPAALLAALQAANNNPPETDRARQWTITTNRQTTCDMLDDAGCVAALVAEGPDYLGSFPAEIQHLSGSDREASVRAA